MSGPDQMDTAFGINPKVGSSCASHFQTFLSQEPRRFTRTSIRELKMKDVVAHS